MSIDIKIEKDIPLPAMGINGKPPCKYPWREMAVGDSFFVVGKWKKSLAGMGSQRHAPKRFVSRRENGGYRIWRYE